MVDGGGGGVEVVDGNGVDVEEDFCRAPAALGLDAGVA